MKVINIETADDETQPKVVIQPQLLAKIEKMVNPSIPEESVSSVAHHFLIGGLAYLKSAPVSDMELQEVANLFRQHKNVFRMFAKALTKVTEGKDG